MGVYNSDGSMNVNIVGSATGATNPTAISNKTLGALGDRLLLPVSGLANAMIHVQGTGVMTLRFMGTADADGVGPAGRRLWKAGVGSLGVSSININGAIDSEYRCNLGGQYMSVEVTQYTSGSVQVFVIADANPVMVFVNGPVHNAEEEALRAGRLFTASTGFVSVAGNNFLNAVFTNPANSGKVAYFEGRRFGCTANSAYGGVSNPTAATFVSPTTVTPSNSRTGAGSSVMQFQYNMSATRIDSSPTNTNPAGGLLVAYDDTTLLFKRAVPPGQSFGNFIGGAGGGLAATATCTLTYYWYEEDLY